MNNLLPLPVLLPLFGAGIALALNRSATRAMPSGSGQLPTHSTTGP